MALPRRIAYFLLGILVTVSLILLFVAWMDPHEHLGVPGSLGILLAFSAIGLLALYNFNCRKTAESGWEELEQRIGFLVQHVKDYAIFLIDPEGRVMSWNNGAQQIKGYSEAEIIGEHISIFYTEEDNRLGEPFLNLQRALEEGRYESVGLRKRKDGSIFYADVVFTPLYDEKHILKGFAKITRDITDQKRAEEDVQVILRREQELNEMKSRFVSLASHEFKTPLSVILSSVSLIEKYPETGQQDQRLKHIHRIKSNVNNLKQILNDFLSLEKLEGGVIQNRPVEADLMHLTREVIQDMDGSLKEGQHILLKTEGAPRPIFADIQSLRNILNNLFSNAIKYSPDGADIDCTLSFDPASVGIAVKDKGLGIPPEEQEHLFERFFRASNTSGISGTGLGLSIVKRYLDLMGGEIRVASIPGEGSIFTVTLPGQYKQVIIGGQ